MLRRLTLLALLGMVAGILFSLGVGHWYSKAAPAVIDITPEGFPVEEVSFPSQTGEELRGWLGEIQKPAEAKGAVLLLHGIRSDRRSMVARAREFSAHGYHILCLDFQAHGESLGKRITLGHLESKNASTAAAWLKERYPELPLIVNGTSLGGACAVMANYTTPPDALIIECVFSDVETGAANRLEMKLGKWARFLHPLLTWQIKPLLGVSTRDLSPAENIKNCTMPILIIHGTEDRHAQISEGRLLQKNAGGECEMWEIGGRGHEGLHSGDPEEWTRRVMDFLDRHLTPNP